MVDLTEGVDATTSNCNIHQRKDADNVFFVHCRKHIYRSVTGIEGTYEEVLPILNIPNQEFEFGPLKVGNTAFFLDDTDGVMYAATTRIQKPSDDNASIKRKRYFFIYKLNDSWTALDDSNTTSPIVTWWEWQHYEAPYIIKRKGWYYLFVSQTQGWKQSRTNYRKATRDYI